MRRQHSFFGSAQGLDPEIAVKVSQDGQQLVEDFLKFQREQPDILYLDINMPLKNGFECLKEIKDSGSFQGMKTVVLSTSSSTAHIEISYRLGAGFYAVNPGSFRQLKKLLAQILAIDLNAVGRSKKLSSACQKYKCPLTAFKRAVSA
ncbi:response regulator [Flavobacterium ustbae]|uniref:response regulator n=1 Tax=Flavobacterium ustbae TaxID=2488790 RepID=UPI000F78D61C|nr:response regulator [Flavobacterium ustbae]